MSLKKRISLSNDVNEVTRLSEFVEEICTTLNLDLSASVGVNLAVEEAVANVINYAFPDSASGKITVTASVDEGQLMFVIKDKGQPFDPTSVHEPDITQTAAERDIGGLGIFLMRHYMDDIHYERKLDENVLTLTKSIITS